MPAYTTIPEEARPLVEEPSKSSIKKLVVVAAFGFLVGAAASTAVSYRKTAQTQLVEEDHSQEVWDWSTWPPKLISPGPKPPAPKPPAPKPPAPKPPAAMKQVGSISGTERTVPGTPGGLNVGSMNEGKLTINGDVNGDLHVGSMNRAHIYVNGRVTGGIITGSLSNGSGIQVTHGCGKATTADSLSGGSKITGSGCEWGGW